MHLARVGVPNNEVKGCITFLKAMSNEKFSKNPNEQEILTSDNLSNYSTDNLSNYCRIQKVYRGACLGISAFQGIRYPVQQQTD